MRCGPTRFHARSTRRGRFVETRLAPLLYRSQQRRHAVGVVGRRDRGNLGIDRRTADGDPTRRARTIRARRLSTQSDAARRGGRAPRARSSDSGQRSTRSRVARAYASGPHRRPRRRRPGSAGDRGVDRRPRRRDWVTLPGRVSDDELVEAYQSAWLVVSALARRGLGHVAHRGRGVCDAGVATDIAGHRGAAIDGVTGVLVDRVGDLGTAVAQLLDDPERRQRIGAGCDRSTRRGSRGPRSRPVSSTRWRMRSSDVSRPSPGRRAGAAAG